MALMGLPAVLALVLLINGFGEETGWRGFAPPRLQARLGPLGGTAALAVLWAAWHAPLFFIVETYRSMLAPLIIFGFGLGIFCGAIVLSHVAHLSQGSVLAAALWHAACNMTTATAAAQGLVPKTGHHRTRQSAARSALNSKTSAIKTNTHRLRRPLRSVGWQCRDENKHRRLTLRAARDEEQRQVPAAPHGSNHQAGDAPSVALLQHGQGIAAPTQFLTQRSASKEHPNKNGRHHQQQVVGG